MTWLDDIAITLWDNQRPRIGSQSESSNKIFFVTLDVSFESITGACWEYAS